MNLLKFISDLVPDLQSDKKLLPDDVVEYLHFLFLKLVEVFETVYINENTIWVLFVREESKPESEEIKRYWSFQRWVVDALMSIMDILSLVEAQKST